MPIKTDEGRASPTGIGLGAEPVRGGWGLLFLPSYRDVLGFKRVFITLARYECFPP